MTDIGNSIRQRREELGYSVEEISEKTKISVVHLNAIERGDMDHFRNDLVFLRFYLKNLSSVLDMDLNEVLTQFNLTKDEFTNTLSLKKIQEKETSEANIAKNKSLSQSEYVYRNFKKKRFEVSFATLMVVIVLIVISLIIVFFTNVLPLLTKTPENIILNPVENVPGEVKPDPNPEPEPEPQPEPTVIIVTKTGLTDYAITDWVKGRQVKFVVKYNSSSMMKVLIDGVLTNNPTSRIYNYGETMEVIVDAAQNKTVTLSFGYIKYNTITVNDIAVPIDPTIAAAPRSFRVVFTFTGGAS